MAKLLRRYKPKEIDKFNEELVEYREFIRKKWDDLKLDGLICPGVFSCAFKSENIEELGNLSDYCMLWNIVPFPAGIVPVTQVKEGEDVGY